MKKKGNLVILVILALVCVLSFQAVGCKNDTTATTETTVTETTEASTTVAETTAAETTADTSAQVGRDIAAMLKEKDNSGFEIVQLNKMVGVSWFNAMKLGIEQFGTDFGLKAYDVGPDTPDAALQSAMCEDLIVKLEPQKSAIICVPNDPQALDPAAKKANDKGIITIGYEGTKMNNITYDMEAYDNVKFGELMMENLAQLMGGEGEYGISVVLLTMEQHVAWANAAVAYQKEHYPNMELVTTPYIETSADMKIGYEKMQELLKAHPNLKGVLGCEAILVMAAGQIVEEKNLFGKLFVVGLAIPSMAGDHIKSGSVQAIFCSNPTNQSYCLGVVSLAALQGIQLQEGDYLGKPGYDIVKIDGKVIWPHGEITITKDNIDQPEMNF
jgi:simple sugar transport system substrate-binding protein